MYQYICIYTYLLIYIFSTTVLRTCTTQVQLFTSVPTRALVIEQNTIKLTSRITCIPVFLNYDMRSNRVRTHLVRYYARFFTIMKAISQVTLMHVMWVIVLMFWALNPLRDDPRHARSGRAGTQRRRRHDALCFTSLYWIHFAFAPFIWCLCDRCFCTDTLGVSSSIDLGRSSKHW